MSVVDRAEGMQVLHQEVRDELVVAALGNPAYDLYNAGDRPEHFYMWGAMGLGTSVGLGVALGAPSARVVAMEGDGGALMNLGAFATIGMLQPRNLVLVIWDNGIFDLTGGQRTAAAAGTDLAAVARAAGIAASVRVSSLDEFRTTLRQALDGDGPWCIVVDTGPTPSDRKKPLQALRVRFLQVEPFVDAARASGAEQPAAAR